MMSTRVKLALSLTAVSIALGFMISLQYKQQLQTRFSGNGFAATDAQQKQLTAELNAVKKTNVQAQSQLAKIISNVQAFERNASSGNAYFQKMQKQLEDERILAGVTPVEGPGITVTLMDGVATGGNVEAYLTHDWDIRSVINELFTAGAEAISINGYRVVATSGVFCTGPVVKVNDHRIGAPFVINAIGDPQTLKSALMIQGGILDSLRARGIRVSQPQSEQKITMPAYTGNLLSSSSN
jgi:uncharacterized protein YlxW (UPF0749 family)